MSEKPRTMLRHFFEMVVDENTTMLDPTCGSANAVRVAREMGAAKVLGIEREKEFYQLAKEAWKDE
ncbi:MAG: site-specific DNA-methyltransferase, partial [Ketobacter sp.]|nr:site-specific DNA-methyltransferase [Ketobacter sp.]